MAKANFQLQSVPPILPHGRSARVASQTRPIRKPSGHRKRKHVADDRSRPTATLRSDETHHLLSASEVVCVPRKRGVCPRHHLLGLACIVLVNAHCPPALQGPMPAGARSASPPSVGPTSGIQSHNYLWCLGPDVDSGLLTFSLARFPMVHALAPRAAHGKADSLLAPEGKLPSPLAERGRG